MTLEDWRARIDVVDQKILELLNERIRYCLEIGCLKQKEQISIYSPDREKEIFERLTALNQGPLTDDAVRRLFERIIDESRRQVKESYESATRGEEGE